MPASAPVKLLAFDCSTETLSVAVQHGSAQWRFTGAGSAQASHQLIGAAMSLLGRAGLALDELDAIVFGRGPGAFTGLRAACAAAQGLAFGAGVPALPVDTLLAVAADAHLRHPGTRHWLALLDARMNEVYAAEYACTSGVWRCTRQPLVCAPENVPLPDAPGAALAGNAFDAYGLRLPAALAPLQRVPAQPSAQALLRLAPALLAAGAAVQAEHALPLYIRNRVALTTAERLARGGKA